MKKILLPLLVLLTVAASAQTPLPGSTTINSRYQWLGGKFQQLKIPMYADTTQYPLWLPRVGGDIMLDTAGADEGVIYVRYNMYWHGVSGNGGSSDTSGYKYFAAQYPLVLIGGGDTAYLSIDTAGLSGGSSVALPYKNIDSLRLHTAASGQGSSTLGYSAPGDGGAASYYWDATSTATDDSLLVIKVTGVTTGRWRQLIVNATVNPKTGGAKGDAATDDYWAVQRSFASAVANGYMVQFPKGTFMNSGTWVAPQNLVIRGSGNRQTIFRSTSDTTLMTFTSSNLIEDIRFFGNNIGSTGLLFAGGNKAFVNRCRFENFKWRGFANLNGQNSEFNNNFSQYNGYFNYWADGEENCIYTNCNANSDETQNATIETIAIYNTNGNNSHWVGGLVERGPGRMQVYAKGTANLSFTDMQFNSGTASALAVVDDATASFTRVQFSVPGYPAVNVRTIGSNAKSNITDCSTVGANGRTNKSLYDGLNLFNGNVRMPIYSSNLAGGTQGSAIGGGVLSFDTTTRTMILRGTGSAMGIGIGAGSGSGTMAKGQRMQIQVYIPHISNTAKELDLNISRATTPTQTFIKKIHEGYNDVIYTAPDSLSSMRVNITQGVAVTGSFGLRSLELSFPGGRDSVGYEFDARTIPTAASQEYTPAIDTTATGSELLNAAQTKSLLEGRKQWRDSTATGLVYNRSIKVRDSVFSSHGRFISNKAQTHYPLFVANTIAGAYKTARFESDIVQVELNTTAAPGEAYGSVVFFDQNVYKGSFGYDRTGATNGKIFMVDLRDGAQGNWEINGATYGGIYNHGTKAKFYFGAPPQFEWDWGQIVQVNGSLRVTDSVKLNRNALLTDFTGFDLVGRSRTDSTLYGLPFDSITARIARSGSGGGGGGSGTVNTGAANRVAYYPSSGTAVDDLPAITASRALASDANGLPVASTTTSTELGYVNGVTSAIQTQLDARVNFLSNSITSSATPAPTGSAKRNEYYITAQAASGAIAAPSGTPVNGNMLLIRIRDNGTARAISWAGIYSANAGFALPLTTIVGEDIFAQFSYNSTAASWQMVGLVSSLAAPVFASGTFATTGTIVSNITASTLGTAIPVIYTRIGNIVTGTFNVSFLPVSAATDVVFRLTIDIASNFTSGADALGTVTMSGGSGTGSIAVGQITADATNDALQVQVAVASTSVTNCIGSFQYIVK